MHISKKIRNFAVEIIKITTSHKTQVQEGQKDYEDLHFRRDRKQVW